MRLPATSTLLAEDQSRAPRLQIREGGGRRWLTADGALPQSVMSLAQPALPIMPNQRAMLAALAITGEPRTVLNLGLGGGAFERYFEAVLPATRVVSVDRDPRMAALAERYFAFPPRAEVHVTTAEGFLANKAAACEAAPFDLILVDLFAGEAAAPCLRDPQFHLHLRDCLAPDGGCAYNLAPATEADLLAVLLALRPALPHAWLRAGEDHGNVVVLATTKAPRAGAVKLSSAGPVDLQAEFSRFQAVPSRSSPP